MAKKRFLSKNLEIDFLREPKSFGRAGGRAIAGRGSYSHTTKIKGKKNPLTEVHLFSFLKVYNMELERRI